MEIRIVEHAGFCFGVKRAVESVSGLLKTKSENTRVFTVGPLIHNQHMIAELEEQGVKVIGEDDITKIYESASEASPCVVVIRAHGVPKKVSETLNAYAAQNEYFGVADLTCPFVKKIHSIIGEHQGYRTVIIGDALHPEVRGICSYSDDYVIYGNSEEILTLSSTEKPVLMVAQTTFDVAEWKKCQENIKKVCTNCKIFDTICSVTALRQSETEELSKNVDIMFVIGSRGSSNTNKLLTVAKRNLEESYLIENASELPLEKVKKPMKVGITAGASTPDGIIQEVKNIMAQNEILETGENFAEMLEMSLKTLNTGETVRGTITSISANELHVDLGTKVTGIIPADEVSDESGVKLDEMFKVGDEITAMVGKVSDRDGVAMLSKKRVDAILKWQAVVDAFNNGTVIEGKVVEAVNGGVVMKTSDTRIFVPASQTGIPKDGDLSVLVGQTKKVKIIDLNEGRKRVVASIRAVEREERKEREAAFWDTIEIGKQYEGEVKSLTSYGAFVDLGGVDGMVHATELSWKRIHHPSEVVSVGEVIKVFVKDFDKEAKRISLGYKTEESNPWTILHNKYNVGDVAEVKIVSLMPFGAFAEVVPGADGLIHISQIADHKITKPADELNVGDVVNVKIIAIDDETHQISLSIRALLEDKPAEETEAETAAEEQ